MPAEGRRWRWRSPPLASSTLMALLGLCWFVGSRESLALVPGLLSSPWQWFRLLSYCLCPTDASLLCVNLLFFLPLGWHPELRLGTLGYLHASAVGAGASALLYLLLLALLGDPRPASPAGSYTPVHLALLGCPQGPQRPGRGGFSGWASVALRAALLLGLTQALVPGAPFLLHLSGLLVGLAYRAGLFSPLGLPEVWTEAVHSWILRRTQAGASVFGFVLPPATEILPFTDPGGAGRTSLLAPSPASWSGGRTEPGPEPGLLFAPRFPPPFSAPPEAPFSALAEDAALQAGIWASLQETPEEDLTLSRSSVSSLRLQQLEKMGFPTDQAVVALAATGHVEGAVALLTGGHVRDAAAVTAARA